MIVRQFLNFGVVGALGFGVDCGVLYLARHLGAGLYLGRGISFLFAVTATWFLNRNFTFKDSVGRRSIFKEWAQFVAWNSIGGSMNLMIYFLILSLFPQISRWPIIAVAAGSAGALVINFSFSRFLVFGAPSAKKGSTI